MLKLLLLAIITGTDGAGTSGFPLLMLDYGPGGAALAGALTAYPLSSFSYLYNPAGLMGMGRKRFLGFEHREYFAGIRDELLVYGLPIAPGRHVGFGLLYTGYGSVEKWSEEGDYLGKFSPYEAALVLGLAQKFGRNLWAGMNVKVLYKNLFEAHGKGVAGDLGFLYRWKSAVFGFSLQNLGPTLRYENTKAYLPRKVSFGASYHYRKTDLVFSLTKFRELTPEAGVGLVIKLSRILSVRVGYKLRALSDERGLRGGFSLRKGPFDLEYAMVGYGLLGLTHHVGLTVELGAPEFKPPKPKIRKPGKSRIEISVYDAVKGDPLSATVYLSGVTQGLHRLGSGERLVLEDLPQGWLKIRVSSEGYAPVEDSLLVAAGSSMKKEIYLKKLRSGVIVGFIRDMESGKALSATIEYNGPDSGVVRSNRALGGVYSIKNLPGGLYILKIKAEGYHELTDSLYLREGERIDRDYQLRRRAEEIVKVEFGESGGLTDSSRKGILSLVRAYDNFEIIYSGEKGFERAGTIRRFLIAQGVDPDRISIVKKDLGTNYTAVRAYR